MKTTGLVSYLPKNARLAIFTHFSSDWLTKERNKFAKEIGEANDFNICRDLYVFLHNKFWSTDWHNEKKGPNMSQLLHFNYVINNILYETYNWKI